MKNKKWNVWMVTVWGLFLILPQIAATTEYWDTPEECVIDSDRIDANKIIVYTCDIIVNNSATWNLSNVTLWCNATANQTRGNDRFQ